MDTLPRTQDGAYNLGAITSDPVLLATYLGILGTELDTARREIGAHQTTITRQQTRMTQQEATITALNARPPQINVQAPPAQPQPHSIKIPLPNKFKGERGRPAKAFIKSVELYFSMKPTHFTTPEDKIKFTLMLLEDRARNWGEPIMENILHPPAVAPGNTTNWGAFKDSFNLMFGDPNEERTAANQLRALTQTRGADDYASEFRNLISILGWEDDGQLRDNYYQGLKDHVKDTMISHAAPTTLDELITLSIDLDKRYWQRQMEKKGNPTQTHPPANRTPQTPNPQQYRPMNPRPPFNPTIPRAPPLYAPPRGPPPNQQRQAPFAPRPPVAPVAPARDPNAMDLSANCQRITPEERQHRLANRLCLYCGGPGHRAQDHYATVAAADGQIGYQHFADYNVIAAALYGNPNEPHPDPPLPTFPTTAEKPKN